MAEEQSKTKGVRIQEEREDKQRGIEMQVTPARNLLNEVVEKHKVFTYKAE